MNLSCRIKTAVLWLPIAAFFIPGFVQAQAAKDSPKAAEAKSDSLAKARAQFARDDLQDAEASIWTVLAANPDQAQVLMLLGNIRVRQQRYSEAEALFRRVLQIDPNSATAHRTLGTTLVTENQPEKALEQFQSALDLAPQDQGLRVETARLYAGQGKCDQSLLLLRAIPQSQFPPDAVPVKAACLLAGGKSSETEPFADQVKGSPSSEIDLAEVFLNAKLPDQALHCLDLAAVSLERKSARFYYLRGRALQAMTQSDAALSALKQALAVDPKFADALVAIAELQADRKKHAEALLSLEKAQTLAPDNVAVLRHLVVEATKAGDGKVSVEAASALADKSPDNPDDLYLAGAALLQQNSAGASTVLEKYVVARTDNAKAWLGLGIAYVQQKRFADARKPLEHSVQLDPSLAEAEYQLGVVTKNDGTPEEAIRHFQRAVQLQPQHAKALWSLGNLYLQSGDLPKAQEALQAAEAVDPNSSETEYDLALTLSKQGKTEIAREHFARYKKLKGDEPPASRDVR